MKNLYLYKTGIGKITIVEEDNKIINVYFDSEDTPKDINICETNILKEAGRQLQEYFSGVRTKFELPLNPKGTDFMKDVWSALEKIPYGETKTYGEIAKIIGRDKAYRAVGLANNKNPIPIFIPCHRVIGANGKLVGYAGGLNIKKQLLELEKVTI
ncbi:methylated-DNA--[protein]-cysteine S-methyltransferase [Clostridium ihumii]|uniref:methylated-DNA--[protein]-cysteine S-methyltransferase n=1 Tax=Clostridium ihumii TaxID=1470356 RepID=UPI00058D07D9|nr:methylated-DNA--[protein]-cysteine S-methyltransferase [Clostridium ihumii]